MAIAAAAAAAAAAAVVFALNGHAGHTVTPCPDTSKQAARVVHHAHPWSTTSNVATRLLARYLLTARSDQHSTACCSNCLSG
eukprot:1152507-Pelagomonas_calceolata.AAC.2